jgi:hypothetical protein
VLVVVLALTFETMRVKATTVKGVFTIAGADVVAAVEDFSAVVQGVTEEVA